MYEYPSDIIFHAYICDNNIIWYNTTVKLYIIIPTKSSAIQ